MESHRNSTSNAVGFSLLPSELLEYIIFKLALPDIFRLKLINKSVASIISDRDFVRGYNKKLSSSSWFFVYKRRWQQNSVLYGLTERCDQWLKISIMALLKFILQPKEDAYFLTAAGNYFIFALNTTQEIIVVNPMGKTVKKIPPSPLGPRGTSMWRRSSMKLLTGPLGSGHFHFLFVDYFKNRPVLVDYNSETDMWRTLEAREQVTNFPSVGERIGDHICLNVANERVGSVLILLSPRSNYPLIVRPRLDGIREDERFVVGFSSGNELERLHVYGDDNMLIIRSGYASLDKNVKILQSVELWGVSANGRLWELISKVPNVLIEKIKKPYGVIMGCLEQRQGIIRAILMSNFEGTWEVTWLCFDTSEKNWKWVPLPDWKMKGVNIAGISFSSGLTLT